MHSAVFNLRKWSTNCTELKNHIPSHDRETASDSIVRTLGICWDTQEDNFVIEPITDCDTIANTKRELFSQVASMYDPLGLLAPIVIKAKILIQDIWAAKVGWDEQLSNIFIEEWQSQKNEMVSIGRFTFPRWSKISDNTINEIHAFCDASSKAYAASVCIKTTDGEKISVSLMTSKYRVAPIKTFVIKAGKESRSSDKNGFRSSKVIY